MTSLDLMMIAQHKINLGKTAMTGIHIHFSSAGRASLRAYLPGSNLGRPDRSAELKKE